MQSESPNKLVSTISIATWKKNQGQLIFEKDFTKYLRLLSFNELIEEYRSIVDDLKNDLKIDNDLAFRSKQILLEFSDRLKINSEQFNSLDEIKKYIDEKVSSITLSKGPSL